MLLKQHARLAGFESAEYHLRKSLKLLREIVAAYSSNPKYLDALAASHTLLGAVLCEKYRLTGPDSSEEHHKAAIDVLEKMTNKWPDAIDYRYSLAGCHNNLGICYLEAGTKNSSSLAEFHIRKAIEISTHVTEQSPTNANYRQFLAINHYNFGGLLLEIGRFEGADSATEHLGKAIEIQEKLTSNFPSVPGYYQDLARSHSRLGMVKKEQQRYTGHGSAEQHLSEAMKILRRLAEAHPGIPEYWHELADDYANLASLSDKQDRRRGADSAEQYYRIAIEIRKRLLEGCPGMAKYRIGLAADCVNLGNVLGKGAEHEGALSCYATAIAVLQPELSSGAKGSTFRKTLGLAHSRRAAILFKLRRYSEAIQDLDRLESSGCESVFSEQHCIFRVLVLLETADFERTITEGRLLVRKHKCTLETLMNLSAAFARRSTSVDRDALAREMLAAQAVEFLREGAKRGHMNYMAMMKQAAFKPLRSRDDYNQLLAELRNRSGVDK